MDGVTEARAERPSDNPKNQVQSVAKAFADTSFLGPAGMQNARRRLALRRVHAHVGRRIVPEGKAAGRIVELEGRNPEIEEDTVEVGVGQRGEVAEVQRDEAKAVLEKAKKTNSPFLLRTEFKEFARQLN